MISDPKIRIKEFKSLELAILLIANKLAHYRALSLNILPEEGFQKYQLFQKSPRKYASFIVALEMGRKEQEKKKVS